MTGGLLQAGKLPTRGLYALPHRLDKRLEGENRHSLNVGHSAFSLHMAAVGFCGAPALLTLILRLL